MVDVIGTLLLVSPPLVLAFILIDSKARLGRFAWGWALLCSIGAVGILANYLSRVADEISREALSYETVYGWGFVGLVVIWAAGIGFYRSFTREEARAAASEGKKISPMKAFGWLLATGVSGFFTYLTALDVNSASSSFISIVAAGISLAFAVVTLYSIYQIWASLSSPHWDITTQ